MSAVDVFISTNDAQPIPIETVLVSVYDVSVIPIVLVAQAQSDQNGRAAFELPDGGYELRFYKRGVLFTNPMRIAVQGDGQYDVQGDPQTLPLATDPRLCRCTGRFVGISNQPVAEAMVMFMQKGETGFEVPKIVDGCLVAQSSLYEATDVQGFLSIDLFRGGEYYVTFSGNDDQMWNIKVPDRASVNLIDLIHPQPVSLAWDETVAPGHTVNLKVGDGILVPFSILFSDFENLSAGVSKWIKLISSAPDFVSVAIAQDQAWITAVAPGLAEISPTMQPGVLPARVPDYGITATPLLVSVT